MTQAVHGTSARSARRDLTARAAIVAACVAMTAIVLLDLADGRLGLLYSVGFVLIVITVPLAVDVRTLFPTGVFPPALLIASLLLISQFDPSAIRVAGMAEDAGTIARLIASTIDHGFTLVIGHGIALGIIALRILTDPDR
ncbi:MAG: DUF6542 domain-containing protein [Aeromicrobium sp.]